MKRNLNRKYFVFFTVTPSEILQNIKICSENLPDIPTENCIAISLLSLGIHLENPPGISLKILALPILEIQAGFFPEIPAGVHTEILWGYQDYNNFSGNSSDIAREIHHKLLPETSTGFL